MATRVEPWVVVGVIDFDHETEIEAVVFIGGHEACLRYFEEEMIKETYPELYMCKVTEHAALVWKSNKFKEPDVLPECSS